MDYVEIKIDPSTLPADQQKVRFQDQDSEEFHDGIYIAEEGMFYVNSSVWFHTWHVLKWAPLQ